MIIGPWLVVKVVGAILAAGVLAVTVADFLVHWLRNVLLPTLLRLTSGLYGILQILVDFVAETVALAASTVKIALHAFKQRVLGIIGSYRRLSNGNVEVSTDVYELSNGQLREVKTQTVMPSADLPDYIREKLAARGIMVDVHHEQDLINEVESRISL